MDVFTLFKTLGPPQAAERCGISRSLAYSIVNGRRSLTRDTAARVRVAFGDRVDLRRTVLREHPEWTDAQIELEVEEIERIAADLRLAEAV